MRRERGAYSVDPKNEAEVATVRAVRAATSQARRAGLPHDLDLPATMLAALRAQEGRCALSGVPLTRELHGAGAAPRPFAPRRVTWESAPPPWFPRRRCAKRLAAVERYAVPRLGERQMTTVGTADLLQVLSPIGKEKQDTAKRGKQRLAAVFDWAKDAGHHPHENAMDRLKKALPSLKYRAHHMPAPPWRKPPNFMADLRRLDGVSARTLELLIPTAARSGEARGARWREFRTTSGSCPASA